MKRIFLICFALALLVSISLYTYNNVISSVNPVKINASWEDQQENLKDAYNNSDVVIIANVKNVRTDKLYEAIVTYNSVKIIESLKGQPKGDIDVMLLGGTYQGKEYKCEEIEHLKNNDTYMFLLKKVYPNKADSNLYAPIGGYQGIIKLAESKNADKISYNGVKFNAKNKIETPSIDKNIKDLLK